MDVVPFEIIWNETQDANGDSLSADIVQMVEFHEAQLIAKYGETNFNFSNFMGIITDTTWVNSGRSNGCISQLYKRIGSKWHMVPIMCLFHSVECLLNHHLRELTQVIFGPIPKAEIAASSTIKSIKTLAYNLRHLYRILDDFGVKIVR